MNGENMNAMEELSRKLRQSKILLKTEHPDCLFYESPERKVLIVYNSDLKDLADQVEQILKLGYRLAGGVSLISREEGRLNGLATFLAGEGG